MKLSLFFILSYSFKNNNSDSQISRHNQVSTKGNICIYTSIGIALLNFAKYYTYIIKDNNICIRANENDIQKQCSTTIYIRSYRIQNLYTTHRDMKLCSYANFNKIRHMVRHANRGRLLLRTPGPVPLWDLHGF